ncbi:MAG: FtsX-like permease family protein [candidate division KSB1 bacterium]|nr:FtsX-like permease family protein [candidate division KSB1 bacterium]
MLTIRLAVKNILGAGWRTWLNVVVLSIAFVAIIGVQGVYEGMSRRAIDAMIQMQLGTGQFWHPNYDPYDPFALKDSHAEIPAALDTAVADGNAVPILISQGVVYLKGRMQSVLLKGIPPGQTILKLPTRALSSNSEISAVIGSRMAASLDVQTGDYITVRWRDAEGTFDAADVRIAAVMETTVSAVDNNQIWLALDQLRSMLDMPGQATLVVRGQEIDHLRSAGDWVFRDIDCLTQEIQELVQVKTVSMTIIYTLLMAMALLAIFDTQILSLWHRRREMGTLMALGMTRGKLIQLFTLEGALHALLAILVGAVYGIPLLTWFSYHGFSMPDYAQDAGFAIGEKIFPEYGAGLVIGTTLLVLVSVTVISYLPTRRIADLEPTDALRGRMS